MRCWSSSWRFWRGWLPLERRMRRLLPAPALLPKLVTLRAGVPQQLRLRHELRRPRTSWRLIFWGMMLIVGLLGPRPIRLAGADDARLRLPASALALLAAAPSLLGLGLQLARNAVACRCATIPTRPGYVTPSSNGRRHGRGRRCSTIVYMTPLVCPIRRETVAGWGT